MKRIYKCLSFFLAFLLNLAPVSCVNEIFDNGLEDLEGECSVSFELQGLPLQSALTRAEGGTAGNAIRNADTLYILFYTKGSTANEADYELAYAFTNDTDCANDVFSKELKIAGRNEVSRIKEDGDSGEFNPGDNDWNGVAESSTEHIRTDEIQIKRGSYAVYVVANVSKFSSADFSENDIATVGKLRNYQLTWKDKNVAANNAMFGFFTKADALEYEYNVINESAHLIKITGKAVTLHAWVKRAVSKVTVAFDGSKLNENVRIYIKNVKICAIPKSCKLGADNRPGLPALPDDLLTAGEQITYTTVEGVTEETRVSRSVPFFPDFDGYVSDSEYVKSWKNEVHSEKRNALYFFENLQGKSNGDPDADGSWKQQTDIDGNGIPDDKDHNNIQKDTKDYGTYIEVEAYYQNDNFGSRSEGIIKYRFMLGKNTTNDFDAERNNHYKLTLCFNKNANDVDWHIEYNEQDYKIEDIIYVSYEYNTPTILPVRFVDQEVSDLSVTIKSSNWYPDEPSIGYYKGTDVTPSDGLSTGFLSLTYDNSPRIGGGEDKFDSRDADLAKAYWDNQANNTTRQYVRDGGKVQWPDLDEFGYNVDTRETPAGNKVFEADIPLFTRPLIIYKWTSWTGANPYYSSSRTAIISITGKVDKTDYSKTIKIIQVPRIENPTGIYRRHDNVEKFDVTCMARTGEMYNSNPTFDKFNSQGAWRATIYRASDGNGIPNNWFTLTKGAQKADAVNEYIQGDPNSPIVFTYQPNGEIGVNDVRCGLIKVEYNNYSCTHYIFVRQGYAPMRLENDKVYWHTFNLYSGSAEATHPCEAGSFFIQGCWAPAILDSNTAGYGVAVSQLSALTNEAGTVTGNVNIPIADSGNYTRHSFPREDRTFDRNNADYNPWNKGRVPTLYEWATLKDENSGATIDKGFGVLYGDGVTETQTDVANAWGCLHADVSNESGKASRGMRGAFVYNESDGRNIFLPIGASGFGRRKVGPVGTLATNGNDSRALGRLQYSFSDTFWDYGGVMNSTVIQYRPLLYNLPTNEGAIYWAQYEVEDMPGSTHTYDNGWDINYKTFDFDFMEAKSVNNAGTISPSNLYSACYIRLVQNEPPQ